MVLNQRTQEESSMSRIKCRTCRRVGESICGREKCAFKKRPFAPGRLDSERKHKSNKSEYGEQLRDKQKLRIAYGLREKQFGAYINKAINMKGVNTQEMIFSLLESRLDNVAFRCGLANTRALARQLVNHGHVIVNGKKISIPSYSVRVGDVIEVREGSKVSTYFTKLAEKFEPTVPSWITGDAKKMSFTIKNLPKELDKAVNYQTIVEFYSR
jgi:small subunit ribosomal protein S4